MKIDEMIYALSEMKKKVGGEKEIAIVRLGFGENDYVVPEKPILGEFEDQDGNEFECAFVGKSGGEEFSKKGVPHYDWNWKDDVLKFDDKTENDEFLVVKMERFYPEDAVVNGENDSDENPKIPGWNGKYITWKIDPKNGTILNWQKGTCAKVWYKVVDEFSYDYGKFHYGPDYVPDFMAIDDSGWGDYVKMTIDGDGKIKNWSFEKFRTEHEKLVKEFSI